MASDRFDYSWLDDHNRKKRKNPYELEALKRVLDRLEKTAINKKSSNADIFLSAIIFFAILLLSAVAIAMGIRIGWNIL